MGYKIKFNEKDGVWRTIGGRRVFIRTGQSMAEAMKESGKFKVKKNEEKETHFAGEELYSDDPNRFGDKLRKINDKMNPTQKEESITDKFASLKERFNPYKEDADKVKNETTEYLKSMEVGTELGLPVKETTSGWTSHGSYSDENSSVKVFKKISENEWSGPRGKVSNEDMTLKALFNDNTLMEIDKANEVRDKMALSDKRSTRTVFNTGTDSAGNKIGVSYSNTEYKNKEYKLNKDVVREQYTNPDNLIKDNLVRKDEGKNKGNNFYVTSISPDDYLNLTTTPELYDKIVNDNNNTDFKLDTDKLDKSYMYLTVDGLDPTTDSAKVVGHNGRHRMLELKKAGYKKAEILVFDASGENVSKEIINKQLTNQFSDDGYKMRLDRMEKVDDAYFGEDLKAKKPFVTNEKNPLEEYAKDSARQKANALANERALQKATLQKAYQEYKKQHPESNISLEDFKKWFK